MSRSASPVDRKLMRAMNQNTLLNLIRLHAPISRTQLMALSGLSSGTVVTITAQLLEQELIVEQGVAEETIAMVLLNLLGEVVASESWTAPLRYQGAAAVQALADGVTGFLSHSGIARDKVLGLGCGFSGYVAAQTGHIVDDWIHQWHDLAIGSLLSEKLQIPVYIDNIMNCLGSYERLFGPGKQYHDFLTVTLGRGIGLAMIVNGEIYRGARGGGGEFGHIPAIAGGRLCECGKRGCLEAYVSDQGLLASYHELCQTHPNDPAVPV